MGIDKFNFSFFFNHSIIAKIQNKNSSIFSNERVAVPFQTHSSNVEIITKPGIYNNVDGLICSKNNNIILTIKVADCVPIYLYDKKKNYYGLIHSGWRGTKNKIIKNAINIFFNTINSNPENILAVIGPHIQKCCYEVDIDVAQYFSHTTKIKGRNKWFLSLAHEIKNDILNLGVPLNNIHISNICTYESLDCESFRRDGEKSDRMIGVIN